MTPAERVERVKVGYDKGVFPARSAAALRPLARLLDARRLVEALVAIP